jgi:hypothetical protein
MPAMSLPEGMPMITPDRIDRYFDTFAALLHGAEASAGEGKKIPVADAFGRIAGRAKEAHAAGHKLMFIGNDGAALTCLGNGLGCDQVFARRIEMHGRPGDVSLYIASHEYGFVEFGHAAPCHAGLDLSIMGDGGDGGDG